MGFLGGTILLAAMAQVIASNALIPLHGTVQLWSNGSRVMFLWRSVKLSIFLRYSTGTIIGSVLASRYLLRFDESIYSLSLGIFILLVTLVPKPKKGIRFPGKWFLVGFMASFIGLFFGAVGTFVGAMFLSEPLEKKEMVATQAACQAILHLAKIIIFTGLGFSLFEWWQFLVLILAATIVGTYWGTKILDKIPQELFLKIFKTLLILLACRLVLVGIGVF